MGVLLIHLRYFSEHFRRTASETSPRLKNMLKSTMDTPAMSTSLDRSTGPDLQDLGYQRVHNS